MTLQRTIGIVLEGLERFPERRSYEIAFDRVSKKFGDEGSMQLAEAIWERFDVDEGIEEVIGRYVIPNIIMDEAAGGKKRTQDGWIEYWNEIKDGRVFASMGDYYQFFKQLKVISEDTADEKAKAESLVAGLREDFDWPERNNWLISSTRLIYSADCLDARIIHHYGCEEQEARIKVPVYRKTPIIQVVSEGEGLTYLQTLLDTKDEGEGIIQILEFVSGKKREEIKVWTAPVEGNYSRSRYPSRAAGFDYYGGYFHVSGSDGLDFRGRSRGVIYPRSGATKK